MALQSSSFAEAATLMVIRKCYTFAVTPSLPDLPLTWLMRSSFVTSLIFLQYLLYVVIESLKFSII